MIKMVVTKAVISKGYDGAAALRFAENAETPAVRFRIGVMVYDKRAENERRFVNINVKAFGYLADRVRNMKLDAGSYVNITGRYDEETWEDQANHAKKSAPVLIADEIEFGGNGKQNGEGNGGNGNGYGAPNGASAANGHGSPPSSPPPAGNTRPSENFTGYEGFGGANPYFPES